MKASRVFYFFFFFLTFLLCRQLLPDQRLFDIPELANQQRSSRGSWIFPRDAIHSIKAYMAEQKANIIIGFASGPSNENHISLFWLHLQHTKQSGENVTGCTWSNFSTYNVLFLRVNPTSHANFSLSTWNTYIHK